MLKKIFLLLSIFISHYSHSYPAQAELFGLSKSMVQVFVTFKGGVTGSGSGIVIKENHVATNCHIFADSDGVNVVKFFKTYTPISVYADWKNDLCILKFDNLPLPSVSIRTTKDLNYEEKIFSMTYPNDNPMPLPSYGKIKALYPFQDSNIIRSSAGFTVGSSGGALFDLNFNLVGITTFKSPGRRENYYYCLPADWIKELLKTKEQFNLKSIAAPFWSLPENQKPFFMKVVLPLQNENWPLMLKIAKAWTQADEENADAWYYLGFAQSKLSNLDFAKLFFKQAIKLNDMHLDSLVELTEIAIKQKDKLEFEKVVNLISKINQEIAKSYLEKISL
ncbi:trypsin-like peptidase domain-containing protein [Methylophilaceae bacterium]|jgi:serine protease Do|nr:trypsin-like peptidase domain-containing protein [Methylophilaceae bacterium]